MGTSFESVLDRSLTLFKDYRLDNLFSTNTDVFYEFLRGFLLNSVDMFDGCLSDLSYTSVEEEIDGEIKTVYYFNETLSSKEIYILCLGLAIAWYNNDMMDVTQMRLHLNTRDFKTYSEQANLKQRSEVLNKMREDLSKNITEYQLNNLSKIPFFGGV